MQKITTHLWYDTEAQEAAEFYTSVLKSSYIKSINQIHDTPSGTVDIVSIDIMGSEFTMISAGPLFKFNPSISFLIACETKEEVEELWKKLSEGGSELMELGEYPFSAKYAWVQDKYGVSWQIMFLGEMPISQRITPTLMFVGEVCGKAEKAMKFYTKIFHNSKIGHIMRYEKGEGLDKEGTIKHAGFTLENVEFAIMDSAYEHKFSFNEAISFMVQCENQDEIDYYWERLSAVPEAEQCGWLKDKFGISWQIVPKDMDKFFDKSDKDRIDRVTKVMLQMKKFNIAELEKAANEG